MTTLGGSLRTVQHVALMHTARGAAGHRGEHWGEEEAGCGPVQVGAAQRGHLCHQHELPVGDGDCRGV